MSFIEEPREGAEPVERPTRLHHHAYVSRNLEATRHFYEDVVGLPLAATWCEEDFGHSYCHTFFELADGSCLAFFQFADPETTETHAKLASTSPFDHIALAATSKLQAKVEARAKAVGVSTQRIDHGYCVSLYLRDPDGLVVELTVDAPDALRDAGRRREGAAGDLARWLAGDHTPNNRYRNHAK